jgi:Bacterial regulatory proteins, luxR family
LLFLSGPEVPTNISPVNLNITEGTVKVHLSNIFAKLGIASRTALTALTIVHREELAAIIAKVGGKY